MLSDWRTKYKNFIINRNASNCTITFDEYINLAKEAGIVDANQIGKSLDSYCMGRIGDTGIYEVGNCRFITVRQNLAERESNGGNIKISKSKLGKNITNSESIVSMANKLRGRNKDNCEHLNAMSIKLAGRTKQSHNHIYRQSEKVSKSFILTSAEGFKSEGHNLAQFCLDNSLDQSAMSKVCRGEASHHKGWKGFYVN